MTSKQSVTAGSQATQRRARRGVALLYALGATLLIFLTIWPLVAGASVTNEEAVWFYSAQTSDGLWDAIRTNWHHRIFRIPDLMGGFLSDAETLGTSGIMWLQIPGFLVLLAAVWVAARRLAPNEAAVFPLAAIWLMLHTSTPLSIWTLANVSNTWSAAVGAWVGLVLWTAIERLQQGRSIWWQASQLAVLCVVGVNVKENFYGWPAAAVLVLACVYVASHLRRRRLPLGPIVVLVAAVTLLPLIHLYLRIAHGGLGWALQPGDARYNLQLGSALLVNLLMSAMGALAVVPVHTVRGIDAPLWLQAVPLLGIALAAATAALPWMVTARRPEIWPRRPSAAAAGLVALYSYAGMSAAWPSGHVGETYFMGANAGAAVIVAVGLVGLWRITASTPRWRWAVCTLAGLSLAIGLYGLVTRSLHYRHIWHVATTLRSQIGAIQQTLEPSDRARIIYLKDCESGRTHSRYILRPARAFNYVLTEKWLNRRYPGQPFELQLGPPPDAADLVVDCSTLPAPPRW